MSEVYEVRNPTTGSCEMFAVQPDPQGRALRYASAMRRLYPSMTFEVWAVTRGSVSRDSVERKLS